MPSSPFTQEKIVSSKNHFSVFTAMEFIVKITEEPIRASAEERSTNGRARSAKLRWAIKHNKAFTSLSLRWRRPESAFRGCRNPAVDFSIIYCFSTISGKYSGQYFLTYLSTNSGFQRILSLITSSALFIFCQHRKFRLQYNFQQSDHINLLLRIICRSYKSEQGLCPSMKSQVLLSVLKSINSL